MASNMIQENQLGIKLIVNVILQSHITAMVFDAYGILLPCKSISI